MEKILMTAVGAFLGTILLKVIFGSFMKAVKKTDELIERKHEKNNEKR